MIEKSLEAYRNFQFDASKPVTAARRYPRAKLRSTIFVACVAWILSFDSTTFAQQPAVSTTTKRTSAEKVVEPKVEPKIDAQEMSHHLELMQLLQDIDPYRPEKDVEGEAKLAGSTTMIALGESWAQRFKLFHPKVAFVRGEDGSDAALTALAKDSSVIAGISRKLTDEDMQTLREGECKDPKVFLVALDPLAIYVHKDNPLQSLTHEQVVKVFGTTNGKRNATTWGDVGVTGPLAKQNIDIHHRSETSGTRQYIQQSIVNGSELAEPKATHRSTHEICQAISDDPGGIGFAGFGDHVDGVRTVSLKVGEEIIPSNEASFLSGRYPIIRPLSLVIDGSQLEQDGGLRKSILRYILSRDGQREAILAGFFPLNPSFIRQQAAPLTTSKAH